MRLYRISNIDTEQTATKVALDPSDRAILRTLIKDARTSYRDLAAAARLSPNATAERVRRLRALGVIEAFSTDINPSSLGLNLQVFVDVKLQRGTTMDAFERTRRCRRHRRSCIPDGSL